LKARKAEDFRAFEMQLVKRFCKNVLLSIAIVVALYLLVWKQRGGNWVVQMLVTYGRMGREEALATYGNYFRGQKENIFLSAILIVFFLLILRMFHWMAGYLKEVHHGIGHLLEDDSEMIQLSPEMQPFETRLNTVKKILKEKKEEAVLAEKRKNELVMYLAHDIRTPLTSVIGYLNLLEENPEMPINERTRNMKITLEKAYRLEKMINEFFEITRYNSQQIKVSKVPVDLYYMMIQLTDELSPVFVSHGNSVILDMAKTMTVQADAEKMARVFSNILKNGAAYSYPGTEIRITAEENKEQVMIHFQNKGKTIPEEKIEFLFEKFYRLDESRGSESGGTELGLAIAKEIVTLHGGEIYVKSKLETVTFTVVLPINSINC